MSSEEKLALLYTGSYEIGQFIYLDKQEQLAMHRFFEGLKRDENTRNFNICDEMSYFC